MKHRSELQSKLRGVCEDMCKDVGAYPSCKQCEGFVEPDSTPGVMTWDELLEHMDNLSGWGREQIKGWINQQKAMIQKSAAQSCVQQDLARRAQIQNKLAGACEDMCKSTGAYPKCTCPGFVQPDSTPGVMTWPELLTHMDQLSDWGHDMIKGWHKQAAGLVQKTGRGLHVKGAADQQETA